MDRWSSGRVALVGDAAYAPAFLSGQGTSIAIAGAYVLASELVRHAVRSGVRGLRTSTARLRGENQNLALRTDSSVISRTPRPAAAPQRQAGVGPWLQRLGLRTCCRPSLRTAATDLSLAEYDLRSRARRASRGNPAAAEPVPSRAPPAARSPPAPRPPSPTTRTLVLRPRDRGVEQLPGQQPRVRRRHQHRHLVGLAALALVDRHGVHGLDVGQPAGREVAAARRRRRSTARSPSSPTHRDAGVAVVQARARSRWRSPASAGPRTSPTRSARPSPRSATARPDGSSAARRTGRAGARTAAGARRASPAPPRRRRARAASRSRERVRQKHFAQLARPGRRRRPTRCARRRRAAPRAPRRRHRRGSPRPARRSTRRTGATSAARRPRDVRRRAEPVDQVGQHRARRPPTPAGRGRRPAAAGPPGAPPPAAGPSSSATPSTSRRRRSRRAAAGCRGGAGTATRCPAAAEQPVQRRRLQTRQPLLVDGSELGDLELHRLLQPRRRLAGRRGQRDPQPRRAGRSACSASSASSRATVVVLPVPGPPVSTVSPLRQRHFRGRALLLVTRGEQPLDIGGAASTAAVRAASASRSSATCCSSRQYRSR